MKCQICQKEVKNLKALTTHIQFKHENDQRGYYDKYFKQEHEGFCKYCNKPSKFDSIHAGYTVYCSKDCMKKDYSKIKKESNPMRSNESKLNQKNTNLNKYGVSQNTKRPEIKEQIKQTNIKKYGVENVSQNEKIKIKALKNREKTNLQKYGVKSSFAVKEINEKCHITSKHNNMIKYGVEYAMQRKDIFEKAQETRFQIHKYKNTNIKYQGSYEFDFLEKFYNKFLDILRGPSIKYTFKTKQKIYFPDFYIPSLNLIIECKNSYLMKIDKDIIECKKLATINKGYNFILIIDKNYIEFNNLYLSFP